MQRATRRIAAILFRHAFAIVLVVLATVATKSLRNVMGESISPLYFAAIIFAAWYGGLGPSLVATAAAGWASAHYFLNYPYGVEFWWDDLIRLSIFLLTAVFISWLTSMRRRAETELQRSNDNLERRVQERTAELRASHERLRESEERFRILVEGVADYALVLLDAKGRVASWNAGAERIYGYHSAEIVGRDAECFFPLDEAGRKHPVMPPAHGDAPLDRFEDEGWRVRKDGSRFWANVISTRLRDAGGEPRGFAQVTRDATELRKLEREVLEISEAEQRRFGHDLHDGLGQELTGLAFLTQNLGNTLAARDLAEAAQAERIVSLINSAIEQTRDLARGFSPVEIGPDGLRAALRDLAYRVESIFDHPCEFEGDRDARVQPDSAALHLYRIAQEAINNAVRHSRASLIRVKLYGHDEGERGVVTVTVEDDGVGLPDEGARRDGLGLRLMLYRARVIGATLSIGPRRGGGTVVQCVYTSAIPTVPRPERVAPTAAPSTPEHEALTHVEEAPAR